MRYPPGPPPMPIIGNLPLAGADPLGTFLRWAAEYGDIFYYRAFWIPVYVLSNPTLIEEVLVRHPGRFIKDRTLRNSHWLLGHGLLTAEGDHWRRQRRLAQPAFHRAKIESYANIMTGYAARMLETWRDGADLDIHQEMMELTLRIVVRTLFGTETEDTESISLSLSAVLRNSSGIRLILPGLFRWLPLPGMKELRNGVAELDRTVYRIIAARRTSDSATDDLLSMLMAARDEDGGQMDDRQLRDEVMTFFIAGHETTALALSWAWALLSANPDVERQLHNELDNVLGGRLPELTDLPNLPYTEAVVKETMRLYPPAWAVAREAAESFDLAGYRIPRGANILMSQWIVHRDPKFFPNPEVFDPGRWAEGAAKLPKFTYFPFGAGPRQCIGTAFAMMEADLLLASIAQRFRAKVSEGAIIEPVPGFTLRPRHGVRVRLSAR